MTTQSPGQALTERRLQELIVELIKKESLSDSIEGADAIHELVAQRKNRNVFPIFSMDHLVRVSCAEAAEHGLEALSNLVLLTDDLNVSITDHEIMRPDIVCYSPEGETLVLIELKKSAQAGRQALTELIAYEQEIKNQLPFLADYETAYVLISTEWSTLLDHAVASAVTWSGRQILCLNATVAGDDVKLRPRIPSAWHITGSTNFPAHSLPCVTYCLYDYKPSDKAADGLDMRLLSALNLMAREGDRIGGHGFALLWRDHLGISLAEYNITVCGVAPFEFYKAMRDRGVISSEQGELIGPLGQIIQDFDPQGHSGSIFKIMQTTEPLLSEISNPHYEGLLDWLTVLPDLVLRAEPLSCEFWGVPGNFVRYFTTHPAVRQHKSHIFNDGQMDWRDPQIGITLLDSFLAPDAFQDGNVRCSDCLHLGSVFGLDWILRKNLELVEPSSQRPFKCRFIWNFYKLSSLLEEVRMLASAAKNVSGPENPFVLSNDPSRRSEPEIDAFIKWIKQHFLQGSYAHGLFFSIGLTGALLFDTASYQFISTEGRQQISDGLGPTLERALTLVLGQLSQLHTEDSLGTEQRAHSEILFAKLGIKRMPNAEEIEAIVSSISSTTLQENISLIVKLADMFNDAVFHEHAKTAPVKPDWDWFQQGIKEMRARGVQHPAVQLLANGTLTTGPLERDGMQWMKPLSDPENEVLFCDQSNGLMVVIITTWDELKSGKHFSVG